MKNNRQLLESCIIKNHYRGYDRYDGLHSPIFKIPFLNQQKFRFYFQQITKRLPGNFRPLLAIPKGYNPVTLGLCLQGFTYLSQVDSEKKDDYLARMDHLIGELVKLQSVRKVQGQSGPQELERKRLAERKTRRSRRDAFEPGNEDRRSRRDAFEVEKMDFMSACLDYYFEIRFKNPS
ncbi:MAG: hypothetical protein DWQ10_09730 [Calditrichaeota bacterium]|nr:MAG: hypothetical protein DWQ10_09730 [Calditrichota bacterium]